MVTPVDFHTPENLLSKWMRRRRRRSHRRSARQRAGRAAECRLPVTDAAPAHSQKYAGLADIADDRAALENFLRMENWIFDSPDQAGAAFRAVHALVLPGEPPGARAVSRSAGARVDLGAIRLPGAQHLRRAGPPRAALGLDCRSAGLIGSRDYTRFRVRRRPHRHLRQREGPGTPAADHRRLAGKPLTRDFRGHRLACESR